MVPLTVPGNESRSSPRSNVFLTAALAGEGASRPVRIRNLSVNGALLEGYDFPQEGKKAQLRRGSLSVQGEIAWQNGKYCGLRFDHTILVREWVKRAGPEAQLRIDAAIEQLRSGARSHWPEPALERANSIRSIADELLQICERIASLPSMSVELAEELIKIEALARSLEQPSRTLRPAPDHTKS
jgi:PilZ domain-containing protein